MCREGCVPIAAMKRKVDNTVAKEKDKGLPKKPKKQNALGDYSIDTVAGDFEIKPVETSKDKIEQPLLAQDERKIIPPLGSSVIISGKSGSGKSTLLQNLMSDYRFYGKSKERPSGWFKHTFLFAPTGASDDVLKALNIPEKHVFTDLADAPAFLAVIQKCQANKLKGGKKAHTVDQICVIFEDVIGETSFMNSPEFKKMFYMVRHLNATTFICTQHFNRVPKVCRLQASFIFFFAGSASEVEIIAEMFAPPLYNKKEFIEIVNEATKHDFSFLTICMKVGWKHRFRRNLHEFFVLPRLLSDDEDGKSKKKKEESKEEKISKDEEDFSAEKNSEALKKVVSFKRDRDVCVNEQAEKIVNRWAYQGPRGRTIW
jgi:Poxvirus A32 protein